MRLAAVLLGFAGVSTSEGVENVSLERGGKLLHLSGKIIIETQDGSLLLHTTDGRLWNIDSQEITERKSNARPFRFLDQEEVAAALLQERPDGFLIHRTAHYVICYNTTPIYAQWCGAMYERLFRGFYAYWDNLGLALREPETPLVALVFSDKESYAEYASREMGPRAADTIGYYSFMTNHVTMYDLTGADRLAARGRRPQSTDHINLILAQPRAERLVATIVHEATHQLAFSSGMHLRLADIPMWLSEGIATYFETPDFRSRSGWRTVGAISRYHLYRFRDNLGKRTGNALVELIQDDGRFKGTEPLRDVYAESWALNYFLIRNYREQYVEYLKFLATKEPNHFDTPKQRVEQFKTYFGGDLTRLDTEFVRAMQRLR